MCTGGINVTQFKLATHQMMQAGELYSKSMRQWADLAGEVGSDALSEKLTEAADQVSAAQSALESAMNELDRLSSEGDSVTITPV